MSTGHRGVFVTIDGPGGAGKTTATANLSTHLTALGYTLHATTEPSHHQLGQIARHHNDTYTGHALACLVAADRYHHLDHEIRPHLAAGHIVICDRYIGSSYVLQRMDGVPLTFIESVNAATELPDLAVILTADADTTAARIHRRGAHSRFEAGLATSRSEAALYQDTIERLALRHYPLLTVNTAEISFTQVTELIAARIVALAGLPQAGRDSA